MIVAIVGSRDYPNLDCVDQYMQWCLDEFPDVEFVSGGARGVDRRCAEVGKQLGLKVTEFIPEWNKYGRSAGFRRNAQIVDYCDRLTAFWSGGSRGTQDSIHRAKKSGKPVTIFNKKGEHE